MVAWDQPVCSRNRDSHHLSVLYKRADLPTLSTYQLEPGHPIPGWSTLPRHPFTQTSIWWYRNINLFSITYAFRPRLRSRLTLPGRAVCRNPWAYGDRDSHPVYRYSFRHNHFSTVQRSLPSAFNLRERSPTELETRDWRLEN